MSGSEERAAEPDEATTTGEQGLSDPDLVLEASSGGTHQQPDITASAEREEAAPSLSAALEAILMVVDEPVSSVTLAQVLERPVVDVDAALSALVSDYDRTGRGFELREIAAGWRFYTRASCAPIVERFVVDGQQARLTQAALETLAVVAYRQPVNRARISAIRGVNVDGVIRTLVSRGLVEECGAEPESGALLYRTTSVFLERLGLNSLDQLPDLGPLVPDIESLTNVDDLS